MFECLVILLAVGVAYICVRKGGYGITPSPPITPVQGVGSDDIQSPLSEKEKGNAP